MKKFLSLALTLALCFSLTVPAFAANKAGDTTFAPQQTTNREQIATMLLRAILYIQDQNKTDYIEQFEDLSLYQDAGQVSSWATQAMGILAHNGIFKGVGGNNIAPKQSCTVEQSILLCYRLYQKTQA